MIHILRNEKYESFIPNRTILGEKKQEGQPLERVVLIIFPTRFDNFLEPTVQVGAIITASGFPLIREAKPRGLRACTPQQGTAPYFLSKIKKI